MDGVRRTSPYGAYIAFGEGCPGAIIGAREGRRGGGTQNAPRRRNRRLPADAARQRGAPESGGCGAPGRSVPELGLADVDAVVLLEALTDEAEGYRNRAHVADDVGVVVLRAGVVERELGPRAYRFLELLSQDINGSPCEVPAQSIRDRIYPLVDLFDGCL